MIMNELYKTQLVADKYNLLLDGVNNKLVLVVKLLDYNNQPVTGKSVKVSVTDGYFTRSEGGGTYDYGGTSTKTVTNTTDSKGEFTVYYTATERGIVTFTANESLLQVQVKGWKKILSSPTFFDNVRFDAYTNEEYVYIQFDGETTINTGSENLAYSSRISEGYLPIGYVYAPASHYPKKPIDLAINKDGTIFLINKSNEEFTHVNGCLFYPIIK